MSKPSEFKHWAKAAQKYFVHPETEACAQKFDELGLQPFWKLGLEASRSQCDAVYNKGVQHGLTVTGFQGDIKDILIPAPHLPDGIHAKVYTPKSVQEVPVIIIYFHGGGLVVGDLNMYEMCMMTLAKQNKAIVVVPEYRWLPCQQDRLAPFNDCDAVTRWVLDNKTAVGGVPSSFVGVAGDSAGGQLCCSVTYSIPGRLAFQVLVYPVADIVLEGIESMEDFWETPGFCGKDMEAMFKWCKLFEEPSHANNPRVNPSAPRKANDPPLSASPPTLMLLVQLDPLRDWGISYAGKLREAGVTVELQMVEGAPHISFSDVENYSSTSAEAHKIVAEYIQRLTQVKQ
ncbi:AB hydrolase superfamily protein C1039.03-like [Elysia marginata]|uniref:AB hydrolase superfamily protein C1039.03-like n=1 Tax=Elysia marginata TaxID=1093978 RepID=A0AAV4JA43_9GAST|nr:AB hydrolase superfamily protein C1039.03-like [Elysia marginata]